MRVAATWSDPRYTVAAMEQRAEMVGRALVVAETGRGPVRGTLTLQTRLR